MKRKRDTMLAADIHLKLHNLAYLGNVLKKYVCLLLNIHMFSIEHILR